MGRIANKDVAVDDLLVWSDLYKTIDMVHGGFYSLIISRSAESGEALTSAAGGSFHTVAETVFADRNCSIQNKVSRGRNNLPRLKRQEPA